MSSNLMASIRSSYTETTDHKLRSEPVSPAFYRPAIRGTIHKIMNAKGKIRWQWQKHQNIRSNTGNRVCVPIPREGFRSVEQITSQGCRLHCLWYPMPKSWNITTTESTNSKGAKEPSCSQNCLFGMQRLLCWWDGATFENWRISVLSWKREMEALHCKRKQAGNGPSRRHI